MANGNTNTLSLIKQDQGEQLKLSLEQGVVTANTIINDIPLLLHAVIYNASQCFTLLLNHPDIKINMTDSLGKSTALHKACSIGHLDMVQTLIKAGADPNLLNRLHESTLVVAIINGKKDIAHSLLDTVSNLDLSPISYFYGTALTAALSIGSRKLTQKILDKLDTVTNQTHPEALSLAIENEWLDTVTQLLEAKQCNPNQINIDDVPTPPGFMKECPDDAPYHHQLIGRLPLIVALEHFQCETPTNETKKIIEKLIEHGASREQPDYSSITAEKIIQSSPKFDFLKNIHTDDVSQQLQTPSKWNGVALSSYTLEKLPQSIQAPISPEIIEQTNDHYMLGLKYLHGIDVKPDIDKAIEHFSMAANHHHAGACCELTKIYLFGSQTFAKDLPKAQEALNLAFEDTNIGTLFNTKAYNQTVKLEELKFCKKIIIELEKLPRNFDNSNKGYGKQCMSM